MAHTSAKAPPPQPKRYRVFNSVGRRLIASFGTEEEAFEFITKQPGPSWRFAFQDGQDPPPAADIDPIHT